MTRAMAVVYEVCVNVNPAATTLLSFQVQSAVHLEPGKHKEEIFNYQVTFGNM